jgi:hypothetical protein
MKIVDFDKTFDYRAIEPGEAWLVVCGVFMVQIEDDVVDFLGAGEYIQGNKNYTSVVCLTKVGQIKKAEAEEVVILPESQIKHQELLRALNNRAIQNSVYMFLQWLGNYYGIKREKNYSQLPFPITHQAIADIVFSSRPTISKIMQTLKMQRLLEFSHGRVVGVYLDGQKQHQIVSRISHNRRVA